MTERERLIELMLKCNANNALFECFSDRPRYRQAAEILADYLLDNGVALPVRCGECEHYSADRKDDKYGVCRYWQYYTEAPEVCADDFCSHRERRVDNV